MSTAARASPRDPTRLRSILQRLDPPRVTLESRLPIDPELVNDVQARLSSIAGRAITIETRVRERLTTSAALVVGTAARIDLDPGRAFLDELDAHMASRQSEEHGPAGSTAELVASAIATTAPGFHLEEAAERGRVLQVGDGVALVEGLRAVRSQEVVRFESGVTGIAFNLLEHAVGCLLLGPESGIREGSIVERTGELLQVPVGDGLLGRMLDALGRPMDGLGPVVADRKRPIEAVAPGVVQRAPVSEPLHTGIKIIDALVPLGRGQRELILGDRKIGKTTLALDVILSQKGTGVICVYAAIGQKASTLATAVALLRERGALAYTVVVASPASDPPGYRYVAPYAACTIAEEIMRRGQHAVVIYDDLSKHAVTYREISALMQRPIGREAYPGDIFYVHARLLERAARLRDNLGGGSLTAIPIVETLAGDISGLIPTNVISICDGQMFLDSALFNEGTRPAMDVGLSVSRVGGMAQTLAMRKVAGRLRIDLAQHHEMARFVRFGAEVDDATLRQLRRGERELEVLKQDAHAPLAPEREVAILFAAVNGYIDDVPVPLLRAFEQRLYAVFDQEHADLLEDLRATGDLSTTAEDRLGKAIASVRDGFLAEHASPVTPSEAETARPGP